MAIKPKLALIPSGVKANKVYSVLPINGTGDFPISRTTDATRINSQGLIETISSNVPRLNYPLIDGVVSGCPSLLLEPVSTNLLTYSEDFGNASWGKQNINLTLNYELSPSGLLNADRVITLNTGVDLYQNISVSANTTYTLTFYAKLRVGENIQARFYDLSNSSNISYVNYSSQLLNNEWKRVEIEVTTPLGCNSLRVWLVALTSTLIDVSYWGAQLEQQSFPTSYIKTLNGASSRGYDNVVNFQPDYWQNQGGIPYIDAYGVSSVPDMFNGLEGVLFLEMKPSALDGVKKLITLSSGYSTDRIMLGYNTNNTFIASVYNNGSYQAVLGGQTLFKGNRSISEFNKIAISYKQNEFKLFTNGTKELEDTSGSVFNADTLKILRFSGVGSVNRFTGEIKQMQYFDSALTDQELEDLTS